MRTLSVPIKVRAILQPNDEAVVGHEMDFESLPYFDSENKEDKNPDVPYLAESVIPRPFSDTNFILRKGVHLNWDFPRFLKTTKFGAKDITEFPAVPNRWLIHRVDSLYNEVIGGRNWILESDVISFKGEQESISNRAQTGLNVDIYSGDSPYAFLGKVWLLEDWENKQGKLAADETTWKKHHQGKPLTALGWGSPSFDVFYPNCRGVFGFHDPEGKEDSEYKIIGWYSDAEDDYWKQYLEARRWKNDFSVKIDELSHLKEDQREILKKERFDELLKNDLGISLGLREEKEIFEGTTVDAMADPQNWSGMICSGEVDLSKQSTEDPVFPDPADFSFGMGNTPVEALSALIAELNFGEIPGLTRREVEDSLTAMLMGDRLKSQKIDIGPKFREFRHAEGFAARSGGASWKLVAERNDPKPDVSQTGKKEMPSETMAPPPLTEEVEDLLENLIRLQSELNQLEDQLDSKRFELYADWCRYMQAAYPPSGQTDEFLEVGQFRSWIERRSLKQVEQLENLINGPGGKKKVLATAQQQLEVAVAALNKKPAADPQNEPAFVWKLQSESAPRFWEPTPPALVVAMPRSAIKIDELLGEKKQHGEDFRYKLLPCGFPETGTWNLNPADKDFSVGDIFQHSSSLSWAPPSYMYASEWPIFKGEWQAEVYPAAGKHAVTKSSGQFDPDFLAFNYSLEENEPDLSYRESVVGSLAAAKSGNIYVGSTYIDQKLDDHYRKLLQEFKALQFNRIEQLQVDWIEQFKIGQVEPLQAFDQEDQVAREILFTYLLVRAIDFLDTHDILTVSLNGFNSALLQRHESIQLHPADPLGFPEYQAFAKRVAAAVKNGRKGVSPDPYVPFLPLRTGALQLLNLRLVDEFGRFTEFKPTGVATAEALEVPHEPDWIRLAPRLAQPARWNFRFLEAESMETKRDARADALDRSPVLGWMIPNLLDDSLDMFRSDGTALGKIGRNQGKVAWLSASDDASVPELLRQLIKWITDPAKTPKQDSGQTGPFLTEFIKDIEQAMDNIHPQDREGQSAFSVLIGRPMAIVRLGVSLQLKGEPAINIGWASLYEDLRRTTRNTNGFERVRFPYQLGEYRQRNDGLIGYWQLGADQKLEDVFHVNDAIQATIDQDKLDPDSLQSISEDDLKRVNWLRQKSARWRADAVEDQPLFNFLRDLGQSSATVAKPNQVKKLDITRPCGADGTRVWNTLLDLGILTEEQRLPNIRHYTAYHSDTQGSERNLSISLVDPMQEFLALVDPFGLIHLSSGIQPVKAIQLPSVFVKEALERMEISFLTAPLLSPDNQLQLSVPILPGYDWQWEDPNSWAPTKPPATAAEEKDKEREQAPADQPADNKADTAIKPETDPNQLVPFQTITHFHERVVIREGRLILTQKKKNEKTK